MNKYLTELSDVLRNVSDQNFNWVARALWLTYENDGTIITCGNGGSAATASHFTCDLMKATIMGGRQPVRSISLVDNIPLITAWSNDDSYDEIFLRQLTSIQRPGDLLFLISASGNSPNILRAASWAKNICMRTVGLTGYDGGELARIVDFSIIVNSRFMPQIEDVHSALCHALTEWMKDALIAQSDRASAF